MSNTPLRYVFATTYFNRYTADLVGTTVSIVENLKPQDLQILRLQFPLLFGLVFSTSDFSFLHRGQLIIV